MQRRYDALAARRMLETLGSVGVETFAVTMTDIEGRKVPRGFERACSLQSLSVQVASRLIYAEANRLNVIVRPHRAQGVELIQLDDLGTAPLERIAALAFLTLQTSPGNFQVWVAVRAPPADVARRLREGVGADLTASGAVRIAGSRNFKVKYAPEFPLVELCRIQPGCIVPTETLDLAGLLAPAKAPRPVLLPAERMAWGDGVGRRARRWPDYGRCVEAAPTGTSGSPKRSSADFVWCMIAVDWGWSIEATAARLLEVSSKATENGEAYAFKTAQNAAAAVGCRREPSKAPTVPGRDSGFG